MENLPKLVMFKMSCSSDPFKAKLGPSKVKPAYNPSIWEAEEGHSWLCIKFKTSWGYMRLVSRSRKKK